MLVDDKTSQFSILKWNQDPLAKLNLIEIWKLAAIVKGLLKGQRQGNFKKHAIDSLKGFRFHADCMRKYHRAFARLVGVGTRARGSEQPLTAKGRVS